jgi:hypothetical protein
MTRVAAAAFGFFNFQPRPVMARTCTASRTLNVLRLVGAAFPGLPLLRVSSDVVRTLIAEATIARQNIASAVAIVERAILAVPIHTTCA